MEAHSWTMRGPLNTDNIRAQDGTLAATIADSTGDVNFQRDIEARDIDVRRNLVTFNNLTVQGPLATFIQGISVGGDAAIVGQVTMGSGIVNTNLTAGGSVAANQLYSTSLTDTVSLRIRGTSPAPGKTLTAVDALGNVAWGSVASIPTGQSILFNTNNTVLGYTILTSVDDEVVYITKGTAAGGQAGGAAKPGSTWTQPTHVHATRSHTLTIAEMPPHSHGCSASSCSAGGGDREAGPGYNTVTTTDGGGQPHNHGDTYGAGGGSTWRPKGRNFTLQQKN